MEMWTDAVIGRRIQILTAVFCMQTDTFADFLYTTNNGAITITGYTGSGAVIIPAALDGYPVTEIAANAFAGIGTISTVQIPASVTNIGNGAFSSCGSLTSIAVEAGNGYYGSLDNVLYDKPQVVLMQFPGGQGPTFTIPNAVSVIADRAFKGCTNLVGLTIPPGVASIGQEALANCTSLTNVSIGNGLKSIQFAAFSNCSSLKSILLPGSLTNIGNYAFTFCGLTDIDIPAGVISIGNVAFANCANLIRATISETVTSIGVYAFSSCTALRGAYFEGNRPQIGTDAFISANQVVIYYPATATGWSSTVAGKPALVWNPVIVTNDANFGVSNTQFSFTIAGSTGVTAIVERSYDLNSRNWAPLETNTFNGSPIIFKDPFSTTTNRFYRLRAP
jgi:hypothetical protein